QQAQAAGRTRESVVAETRNLKADGQLQAVGERADAAPVAVVPDTQLAGRTRADVRAELAQWRETHKLVAGDRGCPGRRMSCASAIRTESARRAVRFDAPPVCIGAATIRGC